MDDPKWQESPSLHKLDAPDEESTYLIVMVFRNDIKYPVPIKNNMLTLFRFSITLFSIAFIAKSSPEPANSTRCTLD